MSELQSLLNDSIMTDVLSQPKEYKQPSVAPPPPPAEEENEHHFAEEPKAKAEPQDHEEADPIGIEMTGETIAALFELPIGVAMFWLNAKAQKKLTAEEWGLLQEIKNKDKSDLNEEELQVLQKSIYTEKELAEIKEDIQYTERERERILYAATKYAEATGKEMTPGQMLLANAVSLLGPKVGRVLLF